MLWLSGFVRAPRFKLVVGGCLLALSVMNCGRWRAQQPHDVSGLADADRTYQVVLDTLRVEHYQVVDRDDTARRVRVRAHAFGTDPNTVSLIALAVLGSRVHLSASGYLVHRDGTTHRSLNTELGRLDEQLGRALKSSARNTAEPPKVAATTARAERLPVAWSEPAYDPAVWGHGNFTCLPIALADQEQSQLSLELSNGEHADVLLSLAHAPELCRSPLECKQSGGCPALGMADAEHVSRLAARLSKHEVGPLATLFVREKAVATIDLTKHGSIAQAMSEAR